MGIHQDGRYISVSIIDHSNRLPIKRTTKDKISEAEVANFRKTVRIPVRSSSILSNAQKSKAGFHTSRFKMITNKQPTIGDKYHALLQTLCIVLNNQPSN
jgi:hypothetical protein